MPSPGERALGHAVRPRAVGRCLAELGLVLGLATLVPALGAVACGETARGAPWAGIALALAGVRFLARSTPFPRDLQRSEALVTTVLAFVLGPLLLAIPLLLDGIPWIDALFEAISGVTTTGLSTLGSLEGRDRTLLLARAWMQWIGGLGFVVLSLALWIGPSVAARSLGNPGLEASDLGESMRGHARRALLIYLSLSGFGVALLSLLGAGPFDALVHTLAAVSTGGFTPRDTSLATLGRPLQCGTLALSLLGAVSLPLYAELRRGRFARLRDDPELRALGIFVAASALLVIAVARSGASPPGATPSDLALLAVSAQSTAGFSTLDVAQLPDAVKGILILSMLSGGSIGSTAGGIKLLRVLALLQLVRWLVARTRLPAHALSQPTLAGAPLGSEELLRAAVVALLFLGAVTLSWLVFLAGGAAPLDALFEVASATGTVGLSAGIAAPELAPFLKLVLCLNMLLGRLEVFAVLVALSPRTWIGRRPD